jgi:ubiquinone/menaquinone biosynthesis C-methylase UbiE
MRMNAFGRLLLNNPGRALAQRHWVLPMMVRLGGGLEGSRVLEIGCGRGIGAELLLDHFGAATVHAVDVDPVMIRLATRRLRGRAEVYLADVTDLLSLAGLPDREVATVVEPGDGVGRTAAPPPVPDDRYDVVIDFGALHLEPRWRGALAEIHRVLRPQGRFCFEEIVGPRRQALMPLATGQSIPAAPTREAFLAELHRSGFGAVDLIEPRYALVTGMIGDLVGVASAGGPPVGQPGPVGDDGSTG